MPNTYIDPAVHRVQFMDSVKKLIELDLSPDKHASYELVRDLTDLLKSDRKRIEAKDGE